jgi:hypothetical protein
MDANSPRHEDDLSACERRLAAWRPAAEGLDADAMLFAAGLAAGRRGRGQRLWPVLCAVLTVQAAALGVWGLSERAQRQALANRVRDAAPAPQTPPATAVAELTAPSYMPSPTDYFHLRRRAEQDPGRWLASPPPAEAPIPQPPAKPAILRAGQRESLFDR